MDPMRVAVLIDADNAPARKIEAILAEVATLGVAHVRRAYGDWASAHLSSWTSLLQEYAIQPIQQFAYTKGKNASDIAMVIDAMDLLHAGAADGFALVSSDADFTPLAMRLRQSGAPVLGFGQQKTPAAFVNACTRFVFLERLGEVNGADQAEAGGEQPSGPQDRAVLRQDTRLVNMLRAAVDGAADDDGWASLSAVSNQIRNQSSFEPRNYGYAKFIDLVTEIDLFDIRRQSNRVEIRRPVKGGKTA